MRSGTAGLMLLSGAAVTIGAASWPASTPPLRWNPRAAAAYLDGRQAWWLTWKRAERDHETSCISCHTAVPYALARPALRTVLREQDLPAPERKLLENVSRRVRLWKEVEPFYPDQTNGLPKSSESRGTEAVLNALLLAMRDAEHGSVSDEARAAFENMWALQFTSGELNGAWAWLNFHLEPWESANGAYFGAALAAVAVGTEPEQYATKADVQDRLKLLSVYLTRSAGAQSLFNRVMLLWASARLPALVSDSARQAIVDALWSAQAGDGGWSLARLGQWKRTDASPLDTASDGYATGLTAYALQRAGLTSDEPHVAKALRWLEDHQDPAMGMWTTTSLNKKRDAATDIGKFMSDAATAYAVLALTHRNAVPRGRN